MKITTEEFEDKGEQDAQGFYDYYYKGQYYFFEERGIKVSVRVYSDNPEEASFLSFNDRPFDSKTIDHPILNQIARYLNEVGFSKLKILNGTAGVYQDFVVRE